MLDSNLDKKDSSVGEILSFPMICSSSFKILLVFFLPVLSEIVVDLWDVVVVCFVHGCNE